MSYTPIMIADPAGNVGQAKGKQKFNDPRLTLGLGAFSRQGNKNANAFQGTIRSLASQGPMMFPSLLR